MNTPSVAVVGGTGFYRWFDEGPVRTWEIETPYGAPSAPITLGTIAGREVAFLPRHGADHAYPPHAINYRANLWALHSIGVHQILAPSAVGGLQPATTPRGAIVVPDQLVDRTSGRIQTMVTEGARHVSFADPYCPRLRRALIEAGDRCAEPVAEGATLVVIEGPRFSTRAESAWYAAQGWDLINMTGHPEAVLARELEICYASIALVTDLDAGIAPGEGVNEQEVYRVFAANLPRVAAILTQTIKELSDPGDCGCTR